MNNKIFSFTTKIKNFKSHFSNKELVFKVRKPITVIAGPNGEGKSNLIDAILLGLGYFITKSTKLKRESCFTKEVNVRDTKGINLSLHRFIFTDILKYGFRKEINSTILQKRNKPKSLLSYKRKSGYIETIINCTTNRGTTSYSISNLSYDSSIQKIKISKNKMDKLDLIYINPNDDLMDLFVKYVGQEFTNGMETIKGKIGQAEYHKKILSYFPNKEGRLITDIDSGQFEEKYSKGTFVNYCLPTGAKKECILYAIGILKEKHINDDNWMAIFLIDEFESGLHITRKKMLIDSLIKSFENDEILRNHVKVILTTHCPVIYSELQKHKKLVDINFVLREPNKPSFVYYHSAEIGDEAQTVIEKRILAELGLNVYSIPNKILFVEGPTDKLFFEEIYQDVFIQPLYTYNLNKPLIDFLCSFPIARSKEYYVLVDKNGRKKISIQIDELKSHLDYNIIIDYDTINNNSLEEFILDIDISSGGNVSTIWNKIERKIESINNILDDADKITIDVKSVRKNLEDKDRGGLKIFLENNLKKNKNFRHHYRTLGKLYRKILSEEQINSLQNFAKSFKLKMR